MITSQMPERQEEVKLPNCPNCDKPVKEIRWQGYGRVYLVVHNKCNTVIGATPILPEMFYQPIPGIGDEEDRGQKIEIKKS